jgi:Tfp pilus assembly protein PilF
MATLLKGSSPPRRRRYAAAWFTGAIATGLLLYFALTFALYWHYRTNRGYSGITYWDVTLPHRWSELKAKKAASLIQSGFAALERSEFRAGFSHLRAGLHRNPSHLVARLGLAEIYRQTGQMHAAEPLLLEGLAYHAENPEYLAKVLGLLFENQRDQQALKVCERLLQNPQTATAAAQLAAWGTAYASYLQGNHDLAADTLDRHGLNRLREGRLLLAKIEAERGYDALALTLLRELMRDYPTDEEVFIALGDALRANGLQDERRRLITLFTLARPDLARPRIERLHDYDSTHDASQIASDIDRIFRDYRHDEASILILGNYAANTGNVPLALRVLNHLTLHQQSTGPGRLIVAEARLVAGDFSSAVADLETMLNQQTQLEPRLLTVASGLQAVGYHALGQSTLGSAKLEEFMRRPGLRADSLLAVANRLEAVNAQPAVRAVLAKAIAVNPPNQPALTRLIQLDLATDSLAELPRHLPLLLAMRKPSPAVLRAAQRRLGRDDLLFSHEHRQALALLDAHPAVNRSPSSSAR